MKKPYYKFDVDAYLSGEIMFCSLQAQGVFQIICALYWKSDKVLPTDKVCKRIAVASGSHSEKQELLSELLSELQCAGVIKIIDDHICVKFLDDLYLEMQERAYQNAENARKRWHKPAEQK